MRRPAPEVAVAEAEAKAAALEESAARLRAAGLEEQAASLEEKAGEQRKISESGPPLGKRLHLLDGYIKRAEGRIDHAKLQQDLEESRGQLAKLRAELAVDAEELPAAGGDEDVRAAVRPRGDDQLLELLTQLAVVAERYAAAASVTSMTVELDQLRAVHGATNFDGGPMEVPQLGEEVRRLQSALVSAQQAGHVDEYERAVAAHAAASKNLARAMRKRSRR